MRRPTVSLLLGAAVLLAVATPTVITAPVGVRPVIFRISSAERSSMGMSAPLAMSQSMVDDGSATWNGTPLSFAASALR